MRARALLAVAAAAALGAAGCGGDDGTAGSGGGVTTPAVTATTESAPPATTPAATTPPVAAQTTATPPATTPAATTTSPEDAPGGAGDEEAARVQARFSLGTGGVADPQSASVQAFLAIRVVLANTDGVAHTVTVGGGEVSVPAGGEAHLDLPGRRATRLPLLVDGTSRATLVVG